MSEITVLHTLKGVIAKTTGKLEGKLISNALELNCEISKSPITIPSYEGEYEITPDQQEHLLSTKKRFMTKDMVIHEIPYFEVSNNSGGITVTIGGK